METLRKITQGVKEGMTSPFAVMYKLQQAEKEINTMIEEVKIIAFADAEPYEKTFEKDGMTVEQRAGGKIWNYKNIPEWIEKKKELTDLEANYKGAYSAYEKGEQIIDEDGVVVSIPEVSFKKNSIIIKKTK